MTESMIDRVARALSAIAPIIKHPWEDLAEQERAYFRDVARAAIAAMREPTPEMISKSMESETVVAWGDYIEFWQAMIDAALEGK